MSAPPRVESLHGTMIDLIIFDCDGVLIDSEVIANRVKAEELRQLGYVITTEQMIDRFADESRNASSVSFVRA